MSPQDNDPDLDLIRKLTLAVDQSPASIFISDRHGTIEYVNDRFCEVTGYSRKEALGRNPRLLSSGLTPRAMYDDMWRTLEAGQTWRGELQNRRKGGELYWDAATLSPLRDPDGTVTHFVAVQVDITERRATVEALEASERRLRRLFETVNLIVLVLDRDARVEYMNPYALRLTGYAEDEVRGADWFATFLASDDMPHLRAVFAEMLEGERHAHVSNDIRTRMGERRRISWHNTVLRDRDGTATGTLSVGEDVTDHDRLEEQFRRAQKMEAVGRLASGVAHDFNNLLTVIISYAELLREQLGAAHPLLDEVDPILHAAEDATALSRQLLAFSRQQVISPRVIVLEELVVQSEKLLRRVIGDDVRLATRLGDPTSTVLIDPSQFDQVVMNLAVNARDAMPDGGTLTIETSQVTLDEAFADAHWPVRPGRYAQLAMSDSGIGMDAGTQARIFEPFFTTKELGKGTGLGLATVYGIVKQSEGFIWVYSEPGIGTTFRIYLPLTPAAAEAPVTAPAPAVRGGTETILLVEDSAAVREATRRALEAFGYTVVAAPDARAALDVAARRAGPIDLLLTDVVMPGLGGSQLAHELAASRPGARVLFMSGYTDDAIVRQRALFRGTHYLQKPFTRESLARKVREALDS